MEIAISQGGEYGEYVQREPPQVALHPLSRHLYALHLERIDTLRVSATVLHLALVQIISLVDPIEYMFSIFLIILPNF